MAREINPERNAFVLPIVANLVLVCVAATVFVVAFANYRERIRRTELTESRFITLEWNLLRELKSETDRQLHEKDQEILALRLRYLELASTSGAEGDRRTVEVLLRQAEREREMIIQNRLAAAIPAISRAGEPAGAPTRPPTAVEPVPEPDSVEIDLGTDRIAVTGAPTVADEAPESIDGERPNERIVALERAIEAERSRAAEVAEELENLSAEYDLVSTTLAQTTEELETMRRRYEQLAEELDDRRRRDRLADLRVEAAVATLRDIELASRDETQQPTQEADPGRVTIEHLGTRALVRAIVASQPIRAEHPNLPDAFEGFIDATERAAVQRGRHDAYRDAVRTIEAVQRELGIPVPVAHEADAATSFRVHLIALVESVLRSDSRFR